MVRFIPLPLLVFCASAAAVDPQAVLIGDAEQQVQLAQLEVELDKAPPAAQRQLLQDRQKLEKLLKELYLRRLLASQAQAEGLDQDPKWQAVIDSCREEVLAKARLSQIRAVPGPDMTAAARDYYRAHLEEFRTPAEVDISHLLLLLSEKRGREETQRLAEELAARIRAGEDIGQLAQQFSADQSAKQNHGRLGWIRPAKIGSSFAEEVLKLKPGQTGVVESRYGLHVVKVFGVRPARPKPFGQVKEEIVARMVEDYRRDQVQDYLDRLRQRSLQLNQKVLDEFIQAKLKALAPAGQAPPPESVGQAGEPAPKE